MSVFDLEQILRTSPSQNPQTDRGVWSLRISVPLLLGIFIDPKLFEYTVLHPHTWWAVILSIALARSPALTIALGEHR
jgi:hypothetical protein